MSYSELRKNETNWSVKKQPCGNSFFRYYRDLHQLNKSRFQFYLAIYWHRSVQYDLLVYL